MGASLPTEYDLMSRGRVEITSAESLDGGMFAYNNAYTSQEALAISKTYHCTAAYSTERDDLNYLMLDNCVELPAVSTVFPDELEVITFPTTNGTITRCTSTKYGYVTVCNKHEFTASKHPVWATFDNGDNCFKMYPRGRDTL